MKKTKKANRFNDETAKAKVEQIPQGVLPGIPVEPKQPVIIPTQTPHEPYAPAPKKTVTIGEVRAKLHELTRQIDKLNNEISDRKAKVSEFEKEKVFYAQTILTKQAEFDAMTVELPAEIPVEISTPKTSTPIGSTGAGESSGPRLKWDEVFNEFKAFIGGKDFMVSGLVEWVKENKGKDVPQSQAGTLLKKSPLFIVNGKAGKATLFKVK